MALPLHVHEFGPSSGPPLLALHGVTGHGARWRSFANGRLNRFRVLAPDLRGHGRSVPLPPWTLEQHAADLLALIDEYDLDAVPVLGHSFGGTVALHLSRLAPGRVSRLALLDPAVGIDPEFALEAASSPQRTFPDRPAAWDAQRADWPTVLDSVISEELLEHLERTPDGWRFRYRAPAAVTAFSEAARAAPLPAPGTPTLLVRALRERFVNPAFVRGCELLLGPAFRVVDLDCGHMVQLERPELVGALVSEFVGAG
jgi:lipase